ncbi:hypothetical protein QBC40DRAFT_279582 [Triangularia verruculosa]|uniref:OTU domain-containing protein n=1 Tax=Triangularia verruculosa TaxID=2587418 RepID=A0AAN6XHJ4_9PEZI|nr:hypothetical protein QBC40DRAFT_279582 [Triangularia verruculosa]
MGDPAPPPAVEAAATVPREETVTELLERHTQELEEMAKRHRKELNDFNSRSIQLKKNATKKNRKKVNGEEEQKLKELTARQQEEESALRRKQQGTSDPESEPEQEQEPEPEPEQPPPSPEKDTTSSADAATEEAQEITPTSPQQQTNGAPGKKRNRQKERAARRKAEMEADIAKAEEEAKNMPNLATQQLRYRQKVMEENALVEKEVTGDGHCMYYAIADQLHFRGLTSELLEPKELRKQAADYMEAHKDYFAPFVDYTDKIPDFEKYLHRTRETTAWGGQLELQALAKVYKVSIKVVVDQQKDQVIGEGSPMLWLSFYSANKGFEHYNSLRPRDL